MAEYFKEMGFKYSISWMITWDCNLNCEYCGAYNIYSKKMKSLYGEFREKNAPVSWNEWCDAFNRLEGKALIDISGGEPFLYPYLLDVIKGIKNTHRIAITTNLTKPIDNFIEDIRPEKIYYFTCSLHLRHKEWNTTFPERVKRLRSAGFPVGVNFVAYPRQIRFIPELYDFYKNKLKVRFTIEPYAGGAPEPFPGYTEEELKLLNRYWETGTMSDLDSARSVRKDILEREIQNRNFKIKKCNAGQHRFMIAPDGLIYPCNMVYMKRRELCLGDFLQNYRLLGKSIVCDLPCTCGGDASNVTIEYGKPIKKDRLKNLLRFLVIRSNFLTYRRKLKRLMWKLKSKMVRV